VQVPGGLGERPMLGDGQDQLQVPNLEDHVASVRQRWGNVRQQANA
jgi:hypothetical protein